MRCWRKRASCPRKSRNARSRWTTTHTCPILTGKIYHAYVPDIPGKEKRKRTPGKAGLLGVEGVPNGLIIDAVLSCGIEESHVQREKITKNDLFELGLSGHPNSTGLRKALAARLRLPSNLSANGLLDAINLLCTRPGLEAILAELNS